MLGDTAGSGGGITQGKWPWEVAPSPAPILGDRFGSPERGRMWGYPLHHRTAGVIHIYDGFSKQKVLRAKKLWFPKPPAWIQKKKKKVKKFLSCLLAGVSSTLMLPIRSRHGSFLRGAGWCRASLVAASAQPFASTVRCSNTAN